MQEKRIDMNNPLVDTYNGKTIYIYHETFDATPYIICSFSKDGTGKFKLNKSDL